jgi:MFS family permease
MTSADEAEGHGFLRPYAEIFSIPRAWRFSVAGVIGRLPMSMYGLGTVLLISAGTGRYGLAGTVAAVSALGNALCAPQLGRLTDQLGQHRVLVPICVIFTLSVAGLVSAVQLGLPDWTLFACGIVGGATMPQLGPMARARWSVLLAGTSRLHTAFSIESIADELCFIVGPAAVTLLATQVHPAAGVACAAICCLGGTLWFAAQRGTEPPVNALPARPTRPSLHRGGLSLRHRNLSLAAPGLIVLVPAYLFLGTMFVSIDLSTVDFAARSGYKPLAGVILGCYALGSATGGLWYGSRSWRAPAWKRLAVTLTALPGRATEAMSWLGTGISVGVALGATAAGFILDAFGPRWGYAFAAAAGVTTVVIYLSGLPRLSRAEPTTPVAASPVDGSPVGGSPVGGSPVGGSR